MNDVGVIAMMNVVAMPYYLRRFVSRQSEKRHENAVV